MKKKIFAGVLVVMMVAAVGCGNSGGGASSTAASSAASSSSAVASSSAQAAGPSSSAVITDSGMVTNQSGASSAAASSTSAASGAAKGSAQKEGTVKKEVDKIEAISDEYKNLDWASMDQQTMNKKAAEWYKLWDDELNSLWERLMVAVKPARKENTIYLQKEWIAKKEAKIKAAGSEAEGGSLQPYLEAVEGVRQTRARAHYIGSLLAESLGGEPYGIPEDAMKVLNEK